MDREVVFFILVLYDPKRGRSAPYATLFMHTHRIRDVLAPSSLGRWSDCVHDKELQPQREKQEGAFERGKKTSDFLQSGLALFIMKSAN